MTGRAATTGCNGAGGSTQTGPGKAVRYARARAGAEEIRHLAIGVAAQKIGVCPRFRNICCADCCEKHHRKGAVEYYHQLVGAVIVHPDKSQVLPLFPETITRQDGASKNDCESNASKRLLPALREAFPQWPMMVVEDRLSADDPHIKLLKKLKYHYIIVAKPSDQPALFEEVRKRLNSAEYEEFEELGEDGVLRGYRWMKGLPLNKSHPDILVNYLDYWRLRNRDRNRGRTTFSISIRRKLWSVPYFSALEGRPRRNGHAACK